jgi:MFS family permease
MRTPAEGKNMPNEDQQGRLFWGCFVALITTAFAFISRMFLIGVWAEEFGLDPAEAGRLAGIGIWPFAVSIIVFSLFIDRIGYKTAMVFSFLGFMIWSIMGVSAFFVSAGGDGNTELGFQLLYWGSLILGLSNGTVEAYINPIVSTMFHKEKTKWLNILHAGWPGGLVIAGLLTIGLERGFGQFDTPWWIRVGIIALPAVAFFLMLIPLKFPMQERVASGVSYREMLAEFGILGASVVGVLITLQLMDFYSNGGTDPLSATQTSAFIGIGVAIVAAFGIYTRALGSLLLFVLALIMMPLATTEIGTDGWITQIMEGAIGDYHPGWVLVYTSLIMLVLRFYAGSIVHRISPLGLLAVSCVLAIAGLYLLSSAAGLVAIIGAATLYGIGKTFFWPTMLGITAEQTPKGGALTLNALGGIGMLAVGTLGFPYIGTLQAGKEIEAIVANEQIVSEVPSLVKDGTLTVLEEKTIYKIIHYETISEAKLSATLEDLPQSKKEVVEKEISTVRAASSQGALANMCVFPATMLVGYILLGLYFKARGGYQAKVLTGQEGVG